MINFFQPAANDQSMFYLGQIFGPMSGLLPIPPGANTPVLLGTLFTTFNSIVLAIGVLIVVYVTVVGVLKTAHEGEFMGKQWSSLWIPIRLVIGIAALVPTATGFCTLQLVMMWVVVQGVNAADTLWTVALNKIQSSGSPYSSGAGSPPLLTDVNPNITSMFQGLVCQASTYANYAWTQDNPYFCSSNAGNSFCPPAALPTFPGGSKPAGVSSDQNSQLLAFPMGPSVGVNGACGTVTYCGSSNQSSTPTAAAVGAAACSAQQQALAAIVPTLAQAAALLVQTDYEYRNFVATSYMNTDLTKVPSWIQQFCRDNGLTSASTCCVQSTNTLLPQNCKNSNSSLFPEPTGQSASAAAVQLYWQYAMQPVIKIDLIGQSVQNYIKTISTAVDTVASSPSTSSLTGARFQEASNYGWIFAGAYYQFIAKMNNTDSGAATPPFQVTGPQIDNNSPLYSFRLDIDAASQLASVAAKSAASTPGSPATQTPVTASGAQAPSQLGQLSQSMSSVGSDIMASFMSTISSTPTQTNTIYTGQTQVAGNVTNTSTGAAQMVSDPLARIQIFGHTILIIVEVFFAVLMALIFVLSIAFWINPQVLGSGLTSNPLGGGFLTLSIWIAPAIIGMLTMFAAYGATLAVYTPMIPYILFTFGAIGWFIAVIEAMVAGPIVALGILSPSGHHEVLGKAEQSLMLLFGIFLRPSLMVFGFLASMLLATVAVTMINMGFLSVMNDVLPPTGPTIIELIAFMGLYVSLVVTALNKCFALIHIIPDRTLRWISGHPESSDQEALHEAKGAVGAAAGGAVSAGSGLSGAGAGALEKGTGKAVEAANQPPQAAPTAKTKPPGPTT